jgi:hypothetical protein
MALLRSINGGHVVGSEKATAPSVEGHSMHVDMREVRGQLWEDPIVFACPIC